MKTLRTFPLILTFLLITSCGAKSAEMSSASLAESSSPSISENSAPAVASEILQNSSSVLTDMESDTESDVASSLENLGISSLEDSLIPTPSPTPYTHPSQKKPAEWDDLDILVMAIGSTLSDYVGDSHTESVSEHEISISIWEDGISFAYLASGIIAEQKDKWNSFTDLADSLYATISQYMSENGHSDYTLVCNIVSDESPSTVLYSVSNDSSQDSSDALSTSSPAESPAVSSPASSLDLPAFDNLYYSGISDSVITDVTLPDGAIYYAYISNSGKRNFTVKIYDSSEHYDLAVNEIGSYSGFYLFKSTDISRIEIHSDGNWSISISQLTFPNDSNYITSLSGSGPYVSYLFDVPSGTWSFTHTGKRNFIVNAYVTDGTILLRKNHDILVNEIGDYSGECYVKIPDGMHLVFCITADGDWTADYIG